MFFGAYYETDARNGIMDVHIFRIWGVNQFVP